MIRRLIRYDDRRHVYACCLRHLKQSFDLHVAMIDTTSSKYEMYAPKCLICTSKKDVRIKSKRNEKNKAVSRFYDCSRYRSGSSNHVFRMIEDALCAWLITVSFYLHSIYMRYKYIISTNIGR